VARFSGLYLIVALVVIYSALETSTFFTADNARVILSNEAITGILTLGLMVSLIAGVFDLSIGANMGWSTIFLGWLQSTQHINWIVSVILTICGGVLIGVINALIVTVLKVDSVIGTLGMQSVLAAAMYWLSDGQSIVGGLDPSFRDLGSSKWLTIPAPVYYLAAIALILWYFLTYRPSGRYLYAVGSNMTAAKLSGLRVVRLQWFGLTASGAVAAFAGVVFTAQLGTASYDSGTPYLLPAFAAAFLGATQIRPGRFNVWGTIIAIYLLAIGVKGLELKWPGEPWIRSLFEGGVLIVAVALASRSARRRTTKSS
jgi:ribose transport system permease protein